ncbi:MAG: hypothetical protein WCH75_21665 [Candidatus Binatia bacterium]
METVRSIQVSTGTGVVFILERSDGGATVCQVGEYYPGRHRCMDDCNQIMLTGGVLLHITTQGL